VLEHVRPSFGIEEDDQLIVEAHRPTDEGRLGALAGTHLTRQSAQGIIDHDAREWIFEHLVNGEEVHTLDGKACQGAIQANDLDADVIDTNEHASRCVALVIDE
jgi:hypothetical protein